MKSQVMNDFLDGASQSMFGRTRTQSLSTATCVCCGGEATKFNDELSKKEYTISGMCQKCQDEIFGEDA